MKKNTVLKAKVSDMPRQFAGKVPKGKPGKSRVMPSPIGLRPVKPDPNGNRRARRAAKREGKVCSICGITYFGFGNNAHPVNDGRCCDDCNMMHVIPTRVALIFAPKSEV